MQSSAGFEFPASLDRTTKIISAVVCVLLIGIAIATRSLIVGRLSALVIALGYAYSPVGYSISEGSLGVKRLIGNGQKVRMYWSKGRRLVLFPPKGNGVPVLMEVKDSEAFIQEVRKAWR